MERIDRKTALITGGPRGIGLGIAPALGRAGAKLALAAYDIDRIAKPVRTVLSAE